MFGAKLKKIRNHFSATQDKMAEFLGIGTRTYTSYERNENNPPYSMLISLCKNQNVNLNWLIADVGNMFNPPEYNDSFEEIFENIENHRKNIENEKQSSYNATKNFLRDEVRQILKDEGIIK